MEWQELLNKFEELGKLFGRELEIMPDSVQKKMMSKKFGIVGPREFQDPISIVTRVDFSGKEVLDTESERLIILRQMFTTPISIGVNSANVWFCKTSETSYGDLTKSGRLDCSLKEFEGRFIFLASSSAHRPVFSGGVPDLIQLLSTLLSPGGFNYIGPNQTYVLELSHIEHTLLLALEDLIQGASSFFRKAMNVASLYELSRWSVMANRSDFSDIKSICNKSRESVGPSKTLRDIRVIADAPRDNGYQHSLRSFSGLLDSVLSLPSSSSLPDPA